MIDCTARTRLKEPLRQRAQLFLWKISQEVNTGWDTYDSAIVCAKDLRGAKSYHPDGSTGVLAFQHPNFAWCARKHVQVVCVGIALPGMKKGAVLASFNAG